MKQDNQPSTTTVSIPSTHTQSASKRPHLTPRHADSRHTFCRLTRFYLSFYITSILIALLILTGIFFTMPSNVLSIRDGGTYRTFSLHLSPGMGFLSNRNSTENTERISLMTLDKLPEQTLSLTRPHRIISVYQEVNAARVLKWRRLPSRTSGKNANPQSLANAW